MTIQNHIMLTLVVVGGLAGCNSAMQHGDPPDQNPVMQVPLDAGADLASGADLADGANGGVLATSCTGRTNQICGAGGTGNCCASLIVPGGTYNRSSDPTAPATVSTFRLDQYEITVGRFRAFVNAGMGTQASPPAAGAGANPNLPGSGWDASGNSALAIDTATLKSYIQCDVNNQTWTANPGANENLAMNCMDWFEAFAFCIWDGGRLPTEAEWNYAAAGGSDQRSYPWSIPFGSTMIDSAHAVYTTGATRVASVGSKSPLGDGKYGHADLAGNVWEWNLDWYASPYSSPCQDCANLTPATYRVLRGGSFANDASALYTTIRDSGLSSTSHSYPFGARCVRAP